MWAECEEQEGQKRNQAERRCTDPCFTQFVKLMTFFLFCEIHVYSHRLWNNCACAVHVCEIWDLYSDGTLGAVTDCACDYM